MQAFSALCHMCQFPVGLAKSRGQIKSQSKKAVQHHTRRTCIQRGARIRAIGTTGPLSEYMDQQVMEECWTKGWETYP